MAVRKQKGIVSSVKGTIAKQSLLNNSVRRVFVAVSGGPDSVALLHVLNVLKKELSFELSACHFNHKIRPESDREELFVKEVCEKLAIDLKVGRHSGERIVSEERAREERFRFFEKIVQDRGEAKVALAHNMDDVAETFLMRMARGTGTRGLSSIPYQRKFFFRPMLDVKRSSVLDFLKEKKIAYMVDPSNYSLDYTRNFVRHNLIPELEKINPNIIETLKSSSEAIGLEFDYIKSARKDLFERICHKEEESFYIKLSDFNPQHTAMKNHLLLEGFARLGVKVDISKKHLDSVLQLARKGEGGKWLSLPHCLRIRVKNGKIYLMRQKDA